MFDSDQQKAVRRRTIPPPSSISFAISTTYEDILEIGKNYFFPEFIDCPLDFFCLADSSGILYQIKEKAAWTLSEFIKEIGVSPSKIRLYIVYRPEVSIIIIYLYRSYKHFQG